MLALRIAEGQRHAEVAVSVIGSPVSVSYITATTDEGRTEADCLDDFVGALQEPDRRVCLWSCMPRDGGTLLQEQ